MHALNITADHWQAALEVPKQIALDLTAPLNLRLQASRMVQTMLKVLLKDEKDRVELKQRSEKIAPPKVKTPVTASAPLTSEEPSDVEDDIASPLDSTHQEYVHEDMDITPEEVPSETRTRYIGRIGPRKFRGKKRK